MMSNLNGFQASFACYYLLLLSHEPLHDHVASVGPADLHVLLSVQGLRRIFIYKLLLGLGEGRAAGLSDRSGWRRGAYYVIFVSCGWRDQDQESWIFLTE